MIAVNILVSDASGNGTSPFLENISLSFIISKTMTPLALRFMFSK